MKLCRIRTADGVRPAIIDANGAARDLSKHLTDLDAAHIAPAALDHLSRLTLDDLPVVSGDYAPILADVRRLLCIGLNYTDHAIEAGMEIPKSPVMFCKFCEATGADDPITIPKGGHQTDWEVELGIVIGSEAHHVSAAKAMDHVAGYCVMNDVTERSFQFTNGGQWARGKSCDGFAPVGPWLVTKDDIPDPQKLDIYCEVNGRRVQSGNTNTMIFSAAEIVAYISQTITLKPGDLIATGTPPGVGMGMKPPLYLKPGDVMHLGIEGLGTQTQKLLAFSG